MQHQIRGSNRLLLLLLAGMSLLGLFYLAGCTGETPQPATMAAPSSTPTIQAATRTPSPTSVLEPTATPVFGSEEWDYYAWLASRPRNMEAYGLQYDPDAVPTLPPSDSINMPIWLNGMPLENIEGEPVFLPRPLPDKIFSTSANLTMFDCMEGEYWDLYCRESSDLLDYNCEEVLKLRGVYADTSVVQGLIGGCSYPPPVMDEPREDYFYRTGCAFRNDIAYFFIIDGDLRLIKTPAELQELFIPITSPEDAVNYAQLMTGLVAEYQLQPEPEYLYFYDPIDATRVELPPDGYRIFLFHYRTCQCEPWVNSEVELLVTREGDITWIGARPWSMTIGFSCAD